MKPYVCFISFIKNCVFLSLNKNKNKDERCIFFNTSLVHPYDVGQCEPFYCRKLSSMKSRAWSDLSGTKMLRTWLCLCEYFAFFLYGLSRLVLQHAKFIEETKQERWPTNSNMKIVETVNSPLKLVSKEFTCPNPTWRQENRIEVRSYK